MKVQCQCGAKYAFDVTPEMARDPVRFVCPGCGLDLSGPINDLVRQELAAGQTSAPVPAPAPVTHTPVSIPAPAPAPLTTAAAPAAPAAPAKLSIARSASTATHGTATEAAPQPGEAEGPQDCPKHHQPALEHCYVCRKPICPKCMELFGYVCSPLCKARAESHGINVPVYAGQKSVREARQWRKIGLIGGAVGAMVVGLLAFGAWYAFVGSRPHAIFRVRFPERAYGGTSQLTDKNQQIVFLHGGLLARYKVGSKTPIWTNEIITQKQIDDEIDRITKEYQKQSAEAARQGVDPEDRPRIPIPMELAKEVRGDMESGVGLFVQDHNIWLARDGKLTRYDWDTGKPGQAVAITNDFGFMMTPRQAGDELLFTEENPFGQQVITHFSLASGEKRTEEIGEPIESAVLAATMVLLSVSMPG